MIIDVKVPSVGESVQEVQVLRWHKRSGERVARDATLVELETDKAAVEIPAPQDGVVTIAVEEGDKVNVGQILAYLETEDNSSLFSGEVEGEPSVTPIAPQEEAPDEANPSTLPADPQNILPPERKVMPAAGRLAAELDLSVDEIPATGRGQRVMKSDVIAYAEARKQAPSAAASPKIAGTSTRPMTRKKLSLMRQRIAERLVEAQHTAAMLTTFNEVDMSAILELRRVYGDQFAKKHGPKLGFMSFFIRATCEALKRYPQVNARIDGDEIVYHHFYDIAVAVSTDRGLVVPVIKDCDLMGFASLEERLVQLAQKAREGSITIDELSGGTFSITNGGIFGSLLSTPILNHPQSAILGMHKIQERAVVVSGKIEARPMMYLALSYDHRIVDGRDAVGFLVTIKELVEEPARLLLGV